MKPMSERLKDFTASQFIDWLCLACVDVREVRTPVDAQEEINKIREAVTERISVLEHRAEAAEQKLAKTYNQPAIGRVDLGRVSESNEHPNARVVCLHEQADWGNFQEGTELFLHPTTAADSEKPVPYAWLVLAPQGDYIERNPDVVAHLEGTGLTKCKPLYLDL